MQIGWGSEICLAQRAHIYGQSGVMAVFMGFEALKFKKIKTKRHFWIFTYHIRLESGCALFTGKLGLVSMIVVLPYGSFSSQSALLLSQVHFYSVGAKTLVFALLDCAIVFYYPG